VRTLVGLDASAAMLERARHPMHEDQITVAHITLVHGDLLGQDFGAERFDLVYSIGVLAEHTPLQPALLSQVARWLRPSGRFAFSTMHRIASLRQTWGGASVARRTAVAGRSGAVRPPPGCGLYADEARVEEPLARQFVIESGAQWKRICIASASLAGAGVGVAAIARDRERGWWHQQADRDRGTDGDVGRGHARSTPLARPLEARGVRISRATSGTRGDGEAVAGGSSSATSRRIGRRARHGGSLMTST
jgi:SAM-dependent methyltransferase